MTTILPTDSPIRYCVTGAGDPITGTTHVGELTGVNPELSVVADADPVAYVAALGAVADQFPPLPESGWLEADVIYQYEGGAVIVRQSHERTIYEPAETPALFIVYREDAESVLEWVVGESVLKGTRRTYEGATYRAIIPHVTQVDWWPSREGVLGVLWELVPLDPPGDEPQPWVQPTGARDAYHLGDLVTYDGWIWECTATDGAGNNVWAPDIYGWTKVEPI